MLYFFHMKFLKRLVFISFLSVSLFAPVSIQWIKGGSSFQTESSSPSVELNSQKMIASSSQVNKGGLSIDPAFAYATYGIFNCSWYEMGCGMMTALYYIVVVGGNVLVGVSGYLLDIFLNHSIQGTSYLNPFIRRGWELLRDITNIVFIFALLYQAFQLVLGSSASASKKIVRVILVALTINFSLYMSFFIIDVSNIAAHTLYNNINTDNAENFNINKKTGEDITTKSASVAIANKINPQTLFDSGYSESTRYQGYALILVALAINIALIMTFLKVTFLFLGRTVGLWIATIISPLAFSSLLIPKMENMSYIGFDRWLKSLLNMAFMAPIFIFFLYLTIKFMHVAIPYDSGSSFVNKILGILVPAGVIITLILLSAKVAKSMSGDFAGIVADYVGKAAGVALGAGLAVATGGAALVGRKTLGRYAMKATTNPDHKMRRWARNGNWVQKKIGEKFLKNADGLSTGSFDISKSKTASFIGKQLGSIGWLAGAKQPAWAKVGGPGEGGYKKYYSEKLEKEAKENKFMFLDVDHEKEQKKKEEEKLQEHSGEIVEKAKAERKPKLKKIEDELKQVRIDKEKLNNEIKAETDPGKKRILGAKLNALVDKEAKLNKEKAELKDPEEIKKKFDVSQKKVEKRRSIVSKLEQDMKFAKTDEEKKKINDALDEQKKLLADAIKKRDDITKELLGSLSGEKDLKDKFSKSLGNIDTLSDDIRKKEENLAEIFADKSRVATKMKEYLAEIGEGSAWAGAITGAVSALLGGPLGAGIALGATGGAGAGAVKHAGRLFNEFDKSDYKKVYTKAKGKFEQSKPKEEK